MSSAVLTSKGQITIPKPVRDRLGLGTGDRVEFVELESGGFAVVSATRDVRSLKGLIPVGGKSVSVAAMNRAVRKRVTGK